LVPNANANLRAKGREAPSTSPIGNLTKEQIFAPRSDSNNEERKDSKDRVLSMEYE